jgi:hypothetical protein
MRLPLFVHIADVDPHPKKAGNQLVICIISLLQKKARVYKTTILSIQYIIIKIDGIHSTTETTTMSNFRQGLLVCSIKIHNNDIKENIKSNHYCISYQISFIHRLPWHFKIFLWNTFHFLVFFHFPSHNSALKVNSYRCNCYY